MANLLLKSSHPEVFDIELSTESAASSYGIPVAIIAGESYGPDDLMPLKDSDPLPWLREKLLDTVLDRARQAGLSGDPLVRSFCRL